tara:strand:+ start:10235 stop:11563 length:1329 start_codon:yes stop_codon:yes gene_type:complete
MLRKVIRYTGIQLTGQFIGIIVTLASTSILYSNLENREYGLISLLMGVFSLISFMKGSLSSAFAKFFAEFDSVNHKLNQVLTSSILISISISILIFFLASFFFIGPILSFLNIPQDLYVTANDAFYLLIPFTIIQILITPFRSYLNIKEDFYTITLCDVILNVSKLAAAFIIIYYQSVLIFFKLILIGQILAAIITLFRFNSFYKNFIYSFDRDTFYAIWNFSKWIFFGSGLFIIKEQAMAIVVNLLFGLNGNASFGIAKQIVDQINNIVNKLRLAMNPLILKKWSSTNLFKSLAQNSALSFLIVFCMILFITIFGDFVLVAWISDVPNNFYTFFYLLSAVILIKTLSIGFYSLFQGFGKIKNYEIFVNITGIVPVILFFSLKMSFFNFFISIIIFELLSFIVQIILAKKELNFNYYSYTINLIRNILNPLRLIKPILNKID